MKLLRLLRNPTEATMPVYGEAAVAWQQDTKRLQIQDGTQYRSMSDYLYFSADQAYNPTNANGQSRAQMLVFAITPSAARTIDLTGGTWNNGALVVVRNLGATYAITVQLSGSVKKIVPPGETYEAWYLGGSWTANSGLADAGSIRLYAGPIIPSGYLSCDGSALNRTTYSTLFSTLVPNKGTATMTIATPGVVTLAGHGLTTGDSAYLTTTGALPTGLAANTLYWVTVIDSNTFKLATTYANAIAATNIATSGTQSGTHTLYWCPWGLGDGSTTFNIPDLREAAPVGLGTRASGVTAHDAFTLGAFKDDQMHGHIHTSIIYTSTPGGSYAQPGASNTFTTGSLNFQPTQSPVSDGTNGTPRPGPVTRGKRLGINFIIKY